MTTLNFSQLPKFQPRRFVPEEADLKDPKTITGLYDRLLAEPISSAADLESWLLKRSELSAAVSQQGGVIYILMTCQTDDKKRADDFKHFIEQIEPILKMKQDELNKKFITALKQFPLNEERYGLYIRELKADLELFREANVPLQTQEDLLGQE